MERPLNSIALVAMVASICLATAYGDEADPRELPAVKRAIEKAEASVKRNRKSYDDANAKTLAEVEKAFDEEVKRLTKLNKLDEALAVRQLMNDFKEEWAVEDLPNKKDDLKKPGRLKSKKPPMVGAVLWNGHYYKWMPEPLSWRDAQKACQDNGGHLVIIEDEKEQAFLEGNLKNGKVNADHLWIGATDELAEGAWVWVDGSPVEFAKWAARQPDNHAVASHYIAMDVADGGRWADWEVHRKFGCICEWDQ
jgi:hypothetical protein